MKLRNVLIIIALILTPDFVCEAYYERGCLSWGGEWLLVPLVLLIWLLAKALEEAWREANESKED